jgi:hypothetical protein
LPLKQVVKYIVGSIFIVIGALIFVGTLLPIASGLIDYGFFSISLSGDYDYSFAYITVRYNPLFNDLSAEFFSLENPYWAFAWSTLFYPIFYNALFDSTIITILTVLILIIAITMIILGILNLFFGSRSSAPSIISLIAGGIVIVLSILEFIMFRNRILGGIKNLHEIIELIGGYILPGMTISARPLGGFYLILIPAIGVIGLSIFSMAFIQTQKRKEKFVEKPLIKKEVYKGKPSEVKTFEEKAVKKDIIIYY